MGLVGIMLGKYHARLPLLQPPLHLQAATRSGLGAYSLAPVFRIQLRSANDHNHNDDIHIDQPPATTTTPIHKMTNSQDQPGQNPTGVDHRQTGGSG